MIVERSSTILAKLFFTAKYARKIYAISVPTREFNNKNFSKKAAKPNEGS